jgi:hypothetical protein
MSRDSTIKELTRQNWLMKYRLHVQNRKFWMKQPSESSPLVQQAQMWMLHLQYQMLVHTRPATLTWKRVHACARAWRRKKVRQYRCSYIRIFLLGLSNFTTIA